MKLSLPEASFESTQESTFHVVKSKESKNNDDNDEDDEAIEEEDDEKSFKNNNKQSYDEKIPINNDESFSSDHRDSSISNKLNKLIETQELKQPDKIFETLSSTKGEHLLSKGNNKSYFYECKI
jgi:hypothetical protein